MRYKWIALVLACALLLCGCAPIEPIESAGGSAQTTATTVTTTVQTTAQTTAVKTSTSTTQPTVSTTTTVATTVRKTLCDGKPHRREKLFPDMQTYRETLEQLDSSAELRAVFDDSIGSVPADFEKMVAMLLEDKFFLIPKSPEVQAEDYILVLFESEGTSSFSVSVSDACRVDFMIFHYELTFSSENKDFPRETYTTKAGLQVTRLSLNKWIFDVDGYPITVSATDRYEGEEFIDTLTFEKVEIK